jgi:hypothetical protein
MQFLSPRRSRLSPHPYPPEGSLCERCQAISIEILSIKGGYVHSTLDVFRKSAATCELCYVFIKSFYSKLLGWTLERHKLKVSFLPHNNNNGDFSNHRKFNRMPKYIWVQVFERNYEESEPKDSPGEETCIYGKPMLCFTEEGDPAMQAGMPWLRKIGAHTGSPSSLQVPKGWLEQCVATEASGHAHDDFDQDVTKSPVGSSNKDSGASNFPTERPTLLLEIHGHHSSDLPRSTVKLIKTHGGVYLYAALSYCWGSIAGAWLTTTNTIEQHLRGIERSDLPATINDAVDVATFLGIEHLWVDALCIIQDSKEDWKIESAKMGGIYQGGLLTIAASKSASSDEGCFNRSEAHRRTVFSDYVDVVSRLKNGPTSNLHFEKSIRSGEKMEQIVLAAILREVLYHSGAGHIKNKCCPGEHCTLRSPSCIGSATIVV